MLTRRSQSKCMKRRSRAHKFWPPGRCLAYLGPPVREPSVKFSTRVFSNIGFTNTQRTRKRFRGNAPLGPPRVYQRSAARWLRTTDPPVPTLLRGQIGIVLPALIGNGDGGVRINTRMGQRPPPSSSGTQRVAGERNCLPPFFRKTARAHSCSNFIDRGRRRLGPDQYRLAGPI